MRLLPVGPAEREKGSRAFGRSLHSCLVGCGIQQLQGLSGRRQFALVALVFRNQRDPWAMETSVSTQQSFRQVAPLPLSCRNNFGTNSTPLRFCFDKINTHCNRNTVVHLLTRLKPTISSFRQNILSTTTEADWLLAPCVPAASRTKFEPTRFPLLL